MARYLIDAPTLLYTGRIPHALMQWTAIATPAAGSTLSTSRSELWNQLEARVGTLVPETLGALLDVLDPITGAQDCFHTLWDGWGWIDGTGVGVLHASSAGEPMPAAAPLPGVAPQVWQGPRLRLPDRAYLLFHGPLSAALRLGWQVNATRFEPQSPNLLWPLDHSWCLATEIDFDVWRPGGFRRMTI